MPLLPTVPTGIGLSPNVAIQLCYTWAHPRRHNLLLRFSSSPATMGKPQQDSSTTIGLAGRKQSLMLAPLLFLIVASLGSVLFFATRLPFLINDTDAVLPVLHNTVARYRDIIPAHVVHSHHLTGGDGLVCSSSTLQAQSQHQHANQSNQTKPATFLLLSLSQSPYSLNQPISWLWHCIQQIRLTNPLGRIILLQDADHPWDLSQKAVDEFGLQVCETTVSTIDNAQGQDYRYHYLSFLMEKLALVDVWHLEYDNMIYADFGPLTATASRLYRDSAVTPIGIIDNVYFMTAGIMFIKDYMAAEALRLINIELLSTRESLHASNDMIDLGLIQLRKGTDFLGNLPVLPIGHLTSNNLNEFGSVFDGASYGQYLDGLGRFFALGEHDRLGWASWNHFGGAAFIRGDIKFSWRKNTHNLWVPYLEDTRYGLLYPVNNLHVYSKHLKEFLSNQESMPPVPEVQGFDRPTDPKL
jgi:hypothetical protein